MSTLKKVKMAKDELYIKSNSRSTISGSSMAPTDFHLSQSFESSSNAGTVSVALEKCHLCGGSRRSFYCKNCVREGNFVHSRNVSHMLTQCNRSSTGDSYACKSKQWNKVKQEREQIIKRLHADVADRTRIEHQKTEAYMRRQRIQMMKAMIQKEKENLTVNRQRLEKLTQRTSAAEQKAEYHAKERNKFLSCLSQLSTRIERLIQEHSDCIKELTMVRRQGVHDLVTYIFPITEIQPRSENQTAATEDAHQSTVSLLADARRTAYIKGRWVFTDSGYEQQYRVVVPTLPGSGDYSLAMVDSKASVTQASGSATDMEYQLECNPSLTIRAALSLTAQLVSLIASYLDVNLPRRVSYSEFCLSELTERRFNRMVLGLNQNVLCLCFTQRGVDIRTIEPQNTLGNLMAVLSSPDIGTSSACCIEDDETAMLMHSIECSLFDGLRTAEEAAAAASGHVTPFGDEDSDSLEDADRLPLTRDAQDDWEQVPTLLPEADMMSTSPSRSALPSYLAESHSNVTNLVTSAASSVASSVASLWRGWGRTTDK